MNKPQKIKFRAVTICPVMSGRNAEGMDKIEVGTVMEVTAYPRVIDGPNGLIEVADLELPSGETLIEVPYANFKFAK